MAIVSLEQYRTLSNAPMQRVPFSKASIVTVQGRLYDLWDVSPDAGVAPTTAVVPTRATVGALGQLDATVGTLNLLKGNIGCSAWGAWILADRLSHQAGLSGTDITAQTTNLPTAALTRYTDGVGVMIGLTIYSSLGVVGSTVTASYTNEAGTGGRTTQPAVIGIPSFQEARRMILLPLQSGDYGAQSVEDVTLATSTGAVGNFGVTLFKPLVMLPVPVVSQSFEWDALFNLGARAPEIVDGACLFWMNLPLSTLSGIMQGELSFAETT